jgi:hypothetical protein
MLAKRAISIPETPEMISLKTVAAAAAVAMMAFASGPVMAKDVKGVTAKVHSAESIECSKRADAKGLHGKARKKFRAHCKTELKKHHVH